MSKYSEALRLGIVTLNDQLCSNWLQSNAVYAIAVQMEPDRCHFFLFLKKYKLSLHII